MTSLQTLALTATMLAASNLFMTFAWYGHLKHLQASPWWIAALASWGIAIFVPFAMLYMGETLKWNYLWAGLCLVGAVWFIFQG